MMRVVVIRHHDVDSAGFIAEAFEARGAELDVHLVPDDGPLPSLDGVDHVVVLGAVNSVNDEGPASVWIAEELAWLRAADAGGRAGARHLLRRPGALRRAGWPGRGDGPQGDRLGAGRPGSIPP